ncbi:hypothetical protein TNCV_4472101 [Trichonephila clavipes]|uniref:Uncharacterized protein n=1 Tax=Trichonephila clavipes TaxID=2585209 RepID=A0A8X6VFX7_TRICX|nr:hypothetical protein TNCV_4472101 [Trichonephila clavipes]
MAPHRLRVNSDFEGHTPLGIQLLLREIKHLVLISPYQITRRGISKNFTHLILSSNLNMLRMVTKLVPKLLPAEQKDLCLEVAQNLQDATNTFPHFMTDVKTRYESQVYGFDQGMQSHLSL